MTVIGSAQHCRDTLECTEQHSDLSRDMRDPVASFAALRPCPVSRRGDGCQDDLRYVATAFGRNRPGQLNSFNLHLRFVLFCARLLLCINVYMSP